MLTKKDQLMSRDRFLQTAQRIPTKVSDRLEGPLRSLIANKDELLKPDNAFFDVHAHSFTIDHIPKNFIKLLNWVSNQDKLKFLQWKDANFAALMGMKEPKKVIDNLVEVYDKYFKRSGINPTLFIVNLCMDLERGISGASVFDYKKQLEQVIALLDEKSPPFESNRAYNYNETILPFIAIDPNNPEAYDYFLSAFIKDYNGANIKGLDNSAPFHGVKLYPCLGYVVQDPVLQDIYRVCEEKSIPITTHCGGLRTRAESRSIEIGRRVEHADGTVTDTKQQVTVNSKKNFKNLFLDPLHWEGVLKKFPKLKVNLAHFGDNIEWINFRKTPKHPNNFVFKTLKMLKKFENVYADISYSYFEDENRTFITAMMQMDDYKNRMMHGSDFFLTEIEKYTTAKIISKLDKDFTVDRKGWHLLTAENPYNFLFEDA